MTLKDLLLKYEFGALVLDLIQTDKPAKDNLYAFKEAFDELRRMEPGDPHGEEIVVDMEVDTDDDGNEIERYLYASNCEGDLWEASLAKEVVIKADVSEERALAQILWHMTFYGFSAEEKTMWDDVPDNRYERKAALLEYRQHCNYARIKCKKRPSELELRCCLSVDEWAIYRKRETHRNRAKRMRDARQNRSIARLERQGKITSLMNRLLRYARDYDYADIKYLEAAKEIRIYEFYSRTTNMEGRGGYILENMKLYFNADLLNAFTGFSIIVEYSERYPLLQEEMTSLSQHLLSLTSFGDTPQQIHLGVTREDSFDIHLLLVCSR